MDGAGFKGWEWGEDSGEIFGSHVFCRLKYFLYIYPVCGVFCCFV
jgi:hypothetical protein